MLNINQVKTSWVWPNDQWIDWESWNLRFKPQRFLSIQIESIVSGRWQVAHEINRDMQDSPNITVINKKKKLKSPIQTF